MMITASGSRCLSLRNTSRPEPSGRLMSSNTAAGDSASKAVIPSPAVAASTGTKPQPRRLAERPANHLLIVDDEDCFFVCFQIFVSLSSRSHGDCDYKATGP